MKKEYLEVKCLKNKKIRAYILDISKSGIGFAAAKDIKTGAIIDIRSKGKIFSVLKAEVVCSSKLKRKTYSYKVGARFSRLNDKQKKSLATFIGRIEKRIVSKLRSG